MKALILAAGKGSRLAPLTDTVPKCCVTVQGQTILARQISALHACGIQDICVVSGYLHEVVKKEAEGLNGDIIVIENNEYERTNNMYSAYLGKPYLAGEAFLMLNGDVFIDDCTLQTLVSYPAADAIVVDTERYLEESMKVVVDGQRITHISKTIPPQAAYGSSIDLYKFSEPSGSLFFDTCDVFLHQKGEVKLWSEVALDAILHNTGFQPCPLNGRWVEIDTMGDLEEAERVFYE